MPLSLFSCLFLGYGAFLTTGDVQPHGENSRNPAGVCLTRSVHSSGFDSPLATLIVAPAPPRLSATPCSASEHYLPRQTEARDADKARCYHAKSGTTEISLESKASASAQGFVQKPPQKSRLPLAGLRVRKTPSIRIWPSNDLEVGATEVRGKWGDHAAQWLR
ncbi:hypothetical protein B0J12DRAFT_75841 [Macrophomina phaseolina]|uniref:Secreted protein n=1 Tax=Macrophomina phaseolina TaxID=35725 RepID=A0ABQ8GBC9_9PEZI|nr:hypothetical protein B0J12DRAFT_75841 [Macrophomina phaseolina]